MFTRADDGMRSDLITAAGFRGFPADSSVLAYGVGSHEPSGRTLRNRSNEGHTQRCFVQRASAGLSHPAEGRAGFPAYPDARSRHLVRLGCAQQA